MSQRIMSVIGVLMLQMLMLRSANGQFGGGGGLGGGGPSTFGYDASSACSKPYSRHGRARFEKLPCDFRRQNWCTVAGSSYPWQAVRRFVQENHGLMKRMYGDERHINILKAELEKNDIELEYEDRNERHYDDARRFQFVDDYEFVDVDRHRDNDHRSKSRDDDYYQSRSFSDSSMDEATIDENVNYDKSSDKTSDPRSRTTDSSSIPPTKTTTTTTTTTSSTTTKTENVFDATTTKSVTDFTISTGDFPSSTEPTDHNESPSTTSTFTTSTNAKTKRVPTTNEKIVTMDEKNSSTTDDKIVSTIAAVTLADIARIKNSSINEIPGERLESTNNHDFDVDDDTIVSKTMIESTTLAAKANLGSTVVSTIDRIDETDSDESLKNSGVSEENFSPTDDDNKQQEFRPRPEYNKPVDVKPDNSNHKSQLFQEVVAKDKQDQPVLKLRGVNACPVKEEVVAPFWANNTRGEVLALLNLYPFEQYVHWEKCTHENKQMYCRDGCRCEQQYRLHRLLAYDPNNECRGIFSDWFKFPSCCVCRCYDLPVEFRVTSRSPRIQKQKLRLRTPSHRRG